MMSYRTPIHQEHRNGGHDSNSQTGGVGDFVGYPPATRFRRGLDFQSGGMDEFLGIGSPFTTQDYLYNEDSFSSDDLLSTPTDAAQDNIQDFAVNDLSWNTNLSFSTTFDHEGEHTDSFSICQAQNQYLNEYYSGSVAGAHFWAADGDTSLNPPWKNCNQNIPRTALRDEVSQ
jgi:hypothetical protein